MTISLIIISICIMFLLCICFEWWEIEVEMREIEEDLNAIERENFGVDIKRIEDIKSKRKNQNG